MNTGVLETTSQVLLAPGRGTLVADESHGTIARRFEALGIEATEDHRRRYRQMLFTTPGVSEFISGVILFDETMRQRADNARRFVEVLAGDGITSGIKVDRARSHWPVPPESASPRGSTAQRERLQEGFDRFDPGLIDLYLRRYAEEGLRLDLHDLLALGRENSEDPNEPFSMAYLTLGFARRFGKLGAELIAWRQALAAHWPEARFGALSMETNGTEQRVTVEVYLGGGVHPEAVRVELYADPVADGQPGHAMERSRKLDAFGHGYEYRARIPAKRPLGDYTPRLVPRHPIAAIPLEAPEILWQR